MDDFANRVKDAGQSTSIDAPQVDEVPDIGGQFLLTLDPVPIKEGAHIHYIVDVTMNDSGEDIQLGVELRALNFETLELVDPDAPETWQDLPVNRSTGQFQIPLDKTAIPGPANAAVPGLDVTVTGAMLATIRSADLWCGDVTGSTNLGTSLNGSTFGAIRITPGTLGTDLPEAVAACPSAEEPDPDMPDAGVDAAPEDDGGIDEEDDESDAGVGDFF